VPLAEGDEPEASALPLDVARGALDADDPFGVRKR
jgi:hypothetical protein